MSKLLEARTLAGIFFAAGLFFAAGGVANAQDAEPGDGPVLSQTGKDIEEVIVNIRFREERLQDTPTAVTAFTGLKLEKAVAQDLRDVGPSTPNLHIVPVVTFPNSAAIHIRGIGIQGIESTEEPAVGISVDGVFIARPIATLLDLFDVERIEILRGPQGMSFGKNSLAGGLNITTKKPSGEFGWHGEVTAGRFERFDFRGAVEFPIIEDKLSARISAMSQNYGGHFRNRVNGQRLGGEEIQSIRATFLWTPGDDFDFTLTTFWLRERSQAPGGENDPDCTPGDPAFPQIICFFGPLGQGESDGLPYVVGRDAPDDHNTDQFMVIGTANWDVGDFVLTSITGYIDTDDLIMSDFDQTELFFFPTYRDQTHYQFSEEVRAASDFSDRDGVLGYLDVVVGIYYLTQKHEIVQSFPTLGNSADYTTQKHDQFALFGQVILHASDKLNFNFGIRYNDETKDYLRNPGTVLDPAQFALIDAMGVLDPNARPSIDFMRTAVPTGVPLVAGKISRDRVTLKAGVDYRFNEHAMGYFQISQGYKAGSFGARPATIVEAGPTDDETSDSFEVGLKTDFLDNRLRVNLTAFHSQFEGLQFGIFIPNPANPTGQSTLNQNIAKATTKGLEIEIIAKPHERVTLELSVGILDAQYDSFCADIDGPAFFAATPTSACGGRVANVTNPGFGGAGSYLVAEDHSDFTLSRAPKLQLHVSGEYTHPMGNLGYLTGRAALTRSSGHFTDGAFNHPKAYENGFVTVDASLMWENADGNWSAKVWGKNITGALILRGLTPTANFFNQKFYGERATWGVTVSWRG